MRVKAPYESIAWTQEANITRRARGTRKFLGRHKRHGEVKRFRLKHGDVFVGPSVEMPVWKARKKNRLLRADFCRALDINPKARLAEWCSDSDEE